MGAPQIIIIVLYVLDLFLTALLHGQKRTGTYSFPATFVTCGVMVWLLWWGGFFG